MSHPFGISLFGASACSLTAFGFTIELNVYLPGSEPDSDDSDFEPTYVGGFGATTPEEYERLYNTDS